MALSNANIQTCHSPVLLRHTLPIPSRDASVAPIHVGLLGPDLSEVGQALGEGCH